MIKILRFLISTNYYNFPLFLTLILEFIKINPHFDEVIAIRGG